MPLRSALLAILVAALWGGNFIAVKLATRELPPVFMLALRFLIVAALMVPFVPRPSRAQLRDVLMISVVLGGLHFGLMFTGLYRIEAGAAAVAVQLGVPFSTLLAVLLFKEALGWRRIVGVAVAFAGVVLIAGAPDVAQDHLGLGLVVAAAFAWAVANMLIKRAGKLDPNMLTAWMSLFAVPQLLLVSLLLEDGQWQAVLATDALGWAATAYTAIGSTVIAYTLWYRLINSYPVSQAVPYTLLAPVFAITGAVLVLGEPLTLLLVIGAALTIAGVALCEVRLRRSRGRPLIHVPPE